MTDEAPLGDVGMTHDIEDLLNLIKELEQRIIFLERELVYYERKGVHNDDSYYWEHG